MWWRNNDDQRISLDKKGKNLLQILSLISYISLDISIEVRRGEDGGSKHMRYLNTSLFPAALLAHSFLKG